ncbi:MAG TPA: glycoside hydrolase family 66 protein [Bryobacteraceae bacterium]|nr:glycoside hydrolase family 66 protein [Bryobacteraceae bacterium]
MSNSLAFFLLTIGAAAAPALFAQGAVESPTARAGPYPGVWPKGMDKNSVPAWAAPGKIHFSRWDGGRIETAKAFLSGWPGLNPPDPDLLYTMTNWYDPSTVRFLKEGGINLIWITLSVGFSNQTEAAHREQVRRYIAECHRQGIHVLAYESIGNMFWEDMFQAVPESKSWVQLDREGKPVPYSAGTYKMMGRITRYMANLSNPEWRAYLLKRIDLAIDSGADGLIYDNNFGNNLLDLYQQIVNYIATKKKDFLLMANFHPGTYVLNRLLNCITTEDGLEPGLYSASSPGYAFVNKQGDALPVGDKLLVDNFGLLAIHENLTDGWKPVMIEDGRREHEERMVGFTSGPRAQLTLAEKMAFGIALEEYVEGRPAHQLITNDPAATATWRGVGKYNRFFTAHEDLYTNAHSIAPLAVILDDRSEGVPLLDGLAARHVLFNTIYERDVTPKLLSSYKAAALLTAQFVRDSALSALEQFARNGGQLIVSGDSARFDEKGVSRQRPSFFSGHVGSGTATYFERLPSIDELAAALRTASGAAPVRFEAPPSILYNVTEQGKRRLVHVLNYTLQPIEHLDLQVDGDYKSARLLSPDSGASFEHMAFRGATVEPRIPRLDIYSVIVLDRN